MKRTYVNNFVTDDTKGSLISESLRLWLHLQKMCQITIMSIFLDGKGFGT